MVRMKERYFLKASQKSEAILKTKPKKKNKFKLGTSDLVRQKKKNTPKVNMFDLKFNRKRFNIVGYKNVKGESGAPLASRAKAIEKRKKTLLKEYKGLNKTSVFNDRRINMIGRTKKRANIYNLDDDVEGWLDIKKPQSVSQAERLEESDSEDDADEALNDKIIEQTNFGGGLLSKKNEDGSVKSKAEILNEMIEETKRRRAERKAEKDETFELNEKLNKQWQEICRVVQKAKDDKMEIEAKADEDDEFGILAREMKFEKFISLPDSKPKEECLPENSEIKMTVDENPGTSHKSILKQSSGETSEDGPKKAAKTIQFMEPRIDENLTLRKKPSVNPKLKALFVQKELKQKLRKEKKSTIREIRRDNEFLASVKYDEMKAKDWEREQKTKAIKRDLMEQEHDFKVSNKKLKLF